MNCRRLTGSSLSTMRKKKISDHLALGALAISASQRQRLNKGRNGSRARIQTGSNDVRSLPDNGRTNATPSTSVQGQQETHSAQRSEALYSITSSARASSDDDTTSPSSLAAFRLM